MIKTSEKPKPASMYNMPLTLCNLQPLPSPRLIEPMAIKNMGLGKFKGLLMKDVYHGGMILRIIGNIINIYASKKFSIQGHH